MLADVFFHAVTVRKTNKITPVITPATVPANNTFKAATASAFVFSPVLAANVIGVSGVFKSLYICFVPRILVGVIPWFVYILIRRLGPKNRAPRITGIWITVALITTSGI